MQNDFPNASQNQIKKWAKLSEVKYRREEGLMIAEGVKVVEEVLASDWQVEAMLVLPEKISYWGKRIASVKDTAAVYQLTRSEWKKLSQDKEPEGLMAIVKQKKPAPLSVWIKSGSGNMLILHEINDPGNLGALMRSARWFGFTEVLLSARSVDPANPKVIRASMGSFFHLNVLSDVDLNAVLPEIKQDYLLIGSDVHEGILPHPTAKKAALLLGSESHGLPDHLLAQACECWRIPGGVQADSLSLPQAAAIMMYEAAKRVDSE